MNVRRLALPLAIIVLCVGMMFAYYDLYRSTAERIAEVQRTLATIGGLEAAGVSLPSVEGGSPPTPDSLSVRVVVAPGLLIVDAIGPLLTKLERSGTAIKPRDSRNFIARSEDDAWTVESLTSQIAWQFANIDSLRLSPAESPPARTALLVVDRSTAVSRFGDVVEAARNAGAAEIFVAVESHGSMEELPWPREGSAEPVDGATDIERMLRGSETAPQP